MLVSVWQFPSASVLYRTTQFLLLKRKSVTVSVFNNSFIIISDALTSWIFHPGKTGPNNILNHWVSDEKCFPLLASRSSCTSVSSEGKMLEILLFSDYCGQTFDVRKGMICWKSCVTWEHKPLGVETERKVAQSTPISKFCHCWGSLMTGLDPVPKAQA